MLVDEADRRAALQYAAQRPAQGPRTGFAGALLAAREQQVSYENISAEGAHRKEVIDEFRRKFYEESGQRLPTFDLGETEPRKSLDYEDPFFRLQSKPENATARAQFDAWKANNKNSDLNFPTEASLTAHAQKRLSEVYSDTNDDLSRVSSFGGQAGAFIGSMIGTLEDPVVATSMLFGAGAASGIVRTAIAEAGIGVSSEALVQASTFQRKQTIEPDRTLDDALTDIAYAGAGGAAFGGTLKAIARGWQTLRGSGTQTRDTHDAGNVVTAEAAKPASRYPKTAEGEIAHRQAHNKALDDVINGRPVELPEAAKAQQTARTGRVFDVDGRSVDVRYEVVEADDLVTSNNDDLTVNEAFPADLQPRDRSRAVSQEQIQNIASRLQPERLGPSPQSDTGAPIIGPDNVVESGNGRTLAIRKAYDMEGDEIASYVNYLKSQGFDTAGFSRPVLVARRTSKLDAEDRVGFTAASNRSTALRLGTAEQAAADARLIDPAALDRFEGGDIADAANRDFTRGFLSKLARSEQGDMLDASGGLSANGIRRMKAALLARAYNRPALLERALEDADSNIKTIAGALEDAAPYWARMRDLVTNGSIPRGMDISDDLTEVIDTIIRARAEGTKIADAFEQAEMFGGPSEIAKATARAMFNENMTRHVARGKISSLLQDYAEEASKNVSDDFGNRLFGEPLEAGDIVQGALERAGRQDVADVMRDRLNDEAVTEISGGIEAENAIILEAERIRANANEPIIVTIAEIGPDGSEVFVDRNIDEIFEAADNEIAEAQRIMNCATGRSVATA